MRKAHAPRALLLLAFLPALAQAQAAGQWRDSRHLWQGACAYCHETGIGPALLGKPLPPATASFFMRQGSGPMPTFRPTQVSDREIQALARWIGEQPGEKTP